jgi:hypothetical protein
MTIYKTYENSRGLIASYHRVMQLVITADWIAATIHSWPARIYDEAKGNLPMSSIIETLTVPATALSTDPLISVQQWLIDTETSPLFGGVMINDPVAPAKEDLIESTENEKSI